MASQSIPAELELASNDSDATWLSLLTYMWPDLKLNRFDLHAECYVAFRNYIEKESRILSKYHASFAVPTLDGTIALVPKLRVLRSKSKENLIKDLKRDYPNASNVGIERSIELVVRVWLTLGVQSSNITIGRIDASVISIDWMGVSLQGMTCSQFEKSEAKLPRGRRHSLLDPTLTVAYLAKHYDLNIEWTSNLADHLHLTRATRTLKVYQHKICLFNHIRQYCADSAEPLIPLAVLEETIDTLNLLFPIRDNATKTLLSREKISFNSLGNCGRRPALSLGRYVYWREQLLDLIDLLEEPAASWKQLLWHRRNVSESIPFWSLCIAFVSLVLTISQVISTVYQVKSYMLAAN